MTNRNLPTSVELLDLRALRGWALRVKRGKETNHSLVVKAITEISKYFARVIAKNKQELENIEWRDIERMLAAIFEELGFRVELTPSSKDGGKDLILECTVSGKDHSYIVEVKHWRSGQRVGQSHITDFVNVIAQEKRASGLYLATYGYTNNAFEALTEVERELIRFGTESKIVSLCRTFVKAESGLWSTPNKLPDLLFEDTTKAEA